MRATIKDKDHSPAGMKISELREGLLAEIVFSEITADIGRLGIRADRKFWVIGDPVPYNGDDDSGVRMQHITEPVTIEFK